MELAAAAAVIFLAAAVQGGIGFGFGLVSVSLLPLLYGVQASVPVISVFGFPLSLSLAIRLRADLSWQRLKPMLIGGLTGVPLGVAFLKGNDPTVLMASLGVVLIGFAFWLGRPGAVSERPAWIGTLAGFTGGILGGAFATSGPPVVAYTSSTPWSPEEIRATLQAYFGSLSLFTISLMAATGLINQQTLTLNAQLLLPLLIGGLVGDHFSRRLSPARFRVLIRGGMAVVGAVMLYRSLTG